MPPRLRITSLAQLAEIQAQKPSRQCLRCYASAAASRVTVPAPSQDQILNSAPEFTRYNPSKLPSHRDPAYRKSQLLRSYVSLLETTPMILLFQHNNLKAVEWASIRRELATALSKVDKNIPSANPDEANLSDHIKLSVIRTNIFEPALRITDFYKPSLTSQADLSATEQKPAHGIASEVDDPSLTHVLSRSAHKYISNYNIKQKARANPLTTLLTGPVATLTFPVVSPAHLKAALQILSPSPPSFPAPTRRANPGYYAPAVQEGLKKLILMGARVDGRVFDQDGIKWIGGIDGGIDSIRAQIAGILQSFAGGIVQTLQAASVDLWMKVDARRTQLDEQANPKPQNNEEQNKDDAKP